MIQIDTDFSRKNTDTPHKIVACLWQARFISTQPLGTIQNYKYPSKQDPTRQRNAQSQHVRVTQLTLFCALGLVASGLRPGSQEKDPRSYQKCHTNTIKLKSSTISPKKNCYDYTRLQFTSRINDTISDSAGPYKSNTRKCRLF